MQFSMNKFPPLRALLVGALVSLGLDALAADAPAAAPPIPVEDFARQPKLRSVTFSPDGKLFAALQEVDGRMNLTVGDLTARKLTRVTSFSSVD
ncbi:MAG: hypothetical protein WCH44_18445, partial [Betaproteobacteria bacterium]